jgi:hypothetical protein
MKRIIQGCILWIACKLYPRKHGKPVIKFVRSGRYAEHRKTSKVQRLLFWMVDLFGHQPCVYGTCNLHKTTGEKTVSVEKQLEKAGYVQHSNFWQKGFVRCAPFVDRWEAWHAMTGNPCKIVCVPDDLFPTLNYMERL